MFVEVHWCSAMRCYGFVLTASVLGEDNTRSSSEIGGLHERPPRAAPSLRGDELRLLERTLRCAEGGDLRYHENPLLLA
jgi:hypothetical protein